MTADTQTQTQTKPKPVSMDTVNDGILHGKLTSKKQTCEVCNLDTRCLEIFEAHMPDGIEIHKTIIGDRHNPDTDTETHLQFLGVSCGDYAKFHRQVAHIEDKMQAKVTKKMERKGKGGNKEPGKKKKKHGRT